MVDVTDPYRAPAVNDETLAEALIPLEPLWLLRSIAADDLGFIRSTWSDSYHDGSRDVQRLAFSRYRDRMHQRIDRIVTRKSAETIVAHIPGDPNHLLGYVVGEGEVLHYVYVRPARRNYGLGRALLDAWYAGHPGVEASHDTKSGARLIRALNLTYNPLAVEAP